MTRLRPRVPIALPISIVILLILGFISEPLIQANTTPAQRATNVLLSAIPFILIFVAIVLAYISVIVLAASVLNDNVPRRVYSIVEAVIIAGIVLGIVGMFQPWAFAFYRLGFTVLLVSTLSFILWSHIRPRGVRRQEELGSVSIGAVAGDPSAHDT